MIWLSIKAVASAGALQFNTRQFGLFRANGMGIVLTEKWPLLISEY